MTLFGMMEKFNINPSIVSHIIKLLAITLINSKGFASKGLLQGEKYDDLFLRVASIIAEYTPMEHKEQVRIAVSKALSKLLPLLSVQEGQIAFGDEVKRFPGQLKLLYSLVLLLNDEQPDIRYYLCESAGLTLVIDH